MREYCFSACPSFLFLTGIFKESDSCGWQQTEFERESASILQPCAAARFETGGHGGDEGAESRDIRNPGIYEQMDSKKEQIRMKNERRDMNPSL